MAQAKKGDKVAVHYKGTLGDGEIFDSSENKEPLRFTIGDGQVITGFEDAIIGMNVGESKKITIAPNQGYGMLREDMIAVVEKKDLPAHVKPVVGQRMEVSQDDGQTFIVTITEVTDANITLDANHPLAGKDLNFELTLVEIV